MNNEILLNDEHRRELQNARAKKYYDKNKQKVLEKQKQYRAEKKQKVVEVKQKRKERLSLEPEPVEEPIPQPAAPKPALLSYDFIQDKKTKKFVSYILNLKTLEFLIGRLEKADLTKKKSIDDAKILFRILGVDRLDKILKKINNVINIIENSKSQQGADYFNNTKKGLAQLVLIIIDNGWMGENQKEALHEPYKRLYERLDFLTREQTKQNKNILLHDIDDYVKRVKDTFGEDSKQFLIAKLYQESTRRDDFKLQIIFHISQATDSSVNYILVPNTRIICETIINSHKTGAVYEPLVKKLSVYLSNLIKKYIIEHNLKIGSFLLGKSPLTRYVSQMSEAVGLKGITNNTLRKMAITKFLSVPRTLEERQQLALELGHSLAMQEGVY